MSERILIVDDEEAIRVLVSKIAQREGVSVDLAKDGGQAIQKLQNEEYAVVLLDLMMPVANGFDVLNQIRQLRVKPLVIVMTAVDAPILRALDASVVHLVLRKPFDVEDVAFLIRLTAKEIARERRSARPSLSSDRTRVDLA